MLIPAVVLGINSQVDYVTENEKRLWGSHLNAGPSGMMWFSYTHGPNIQWPPALSLSTVLVLPSDICGVPQSSNTADVPRRAWAHWWGCRPMLASRRGWALKWGWQQRGGGCAGLVYFSQPSSREGPSWGLPSPPQTEHRALPPIKIRCLPAFHRKGTCQEEKGLSFDLLVSSSFPSSVAHPAVVIRRRDMRGPIGCWDTILLPTHCLKTSVLYKHH